LGAILPKTHHEICDEAMTNKVLLEAMKVEGAAIWYRAGIYAGVAIGVLVRGKGW
jgi:hypothetical protein